MARSLFITNQDHRSLKRRLDDLIQHSAELKFLVGFFYFSGWQELYERLKNTQDLQIKVLVGLNADRYLGQTIEIGLDGKRLNNEEFADRFFHSLEKALNSSELDIEEFYEQIDFFLQLLEEGKLEIKKTREPNHAKLYLFKIKDSTLLDKEFITGSSNLTRAGLRGQNEMNVEIRDYGSEEAEKWFDELWQTALPITDEEHRKKYLIDLLKNRSQVAEVTPFEAYVLVLKTYVELMEQKTVKPHVLRLLEENGYKDYQYQLDAVNQALTIVENYNGVIIADVVGLGKSIITGLVAKSLGKRGMVLCPPGLMGDKNAKSGWRKYCHDFKLYDWEVRSTGDLESAAQYVREHGEDIEIVIVDESHRFRNQDTINYEWLHTICRNRIVILMTATPFNNSPEDIFSLLKLFVVPGKSDVTLDDNLEDRFSVYARVFKHLSYIIKNYNSPDPEKRQRAENYYQGLFEELPIDLSKVKARSHRLSQEIRSVLEPVMIRRNRLDLKNDPIYCREVDQLSETRDPEELFFDLSPEQSRFYDQIIDEFFGEEGQFNGAIYQPFSYEKKVGDEAELDEKENRAFQQQRNLYEFMRRLLVKRFESSFGAFRKSIENFKAVHQKVLQFIENSGGRYILDRSLLEKIYESDPEEIDSILEQFASNLDKEKIPRNERVYDINEFQLKDEFLYGINDDLQLMESLLDKMDEMQLVESDPKVKCLIAKVDELINTKPPKHEPRRKVIIFTEYVDTVKHLEPYLEEAFPGKVMTFKGTLTEKSESELLAHFDASVKEEEQKDKYDILLTSDKLSEGMNLNRAGSIFNYDIPWNPTRVIQRVGRINRIGKKVFDELYIYNFFPTETGSGIVKSRQVAEQKMFLIHNTLGEDVKIFDVDEEPNASELFKRVNRNPDDLEDESLLTKVRSIYFDFKDKYPEIVNRVDGFPPRVKTAKKSDKNELFVVQKKKLGLFIQQVSDTQDEKVNVVDTLFDSMLPQIECSPDEERLNLSPNFWNSYRAIQEHQQEFKVGKSDATLEVKALNNLQSALKNYKSELGELLSFVRTLIDDLRNYKTLSKYSLRRITQHEVKPQSSSAFEDFCKELEGLRRYLGDDYLEVVKVKLQSVDYDVIIGIENQKW